MQRAEPAAVRSGRPRPRPRGRLPHALLLVAASVAAPGCSVWVTFGSTGDADAGAEDAAIDGADDADAADVPADPGFDDVETDDSGTDAEDGDDVQPVCGNRVIEVGEDCDGDPPESCATLCPTLGPGAHACGPDCRWLPCERVGAVEECNDLDDDCDGTTDEGFACRRGASTACTTTCGSVGLGWCTEACGPPDPEDCVPPTEACNGLDDDCDGLADDGFDCAFGSRVACTTDCGTPGQGTCTAACRAPAGPACRGTAREVCNDVDDDCDGFVNDGIWAPDPGFEAVRLTVSAGRTSRFADLAWSPTAREFGVVWVEETDAGADVRFTRVTADGTDPMAEDTLVSSVTSGTCPPPCVHADPTIAWTGSEWVVAWSDARDAEIYVRRLAAGGTPVGGEIRVTRADGLSADPTLVWTGTELGLAWTDRRESRSRVYLNLLDADGTPRSADAGLAAASSVDATEGYLGWAGTGYGVVWRESGDPLGEVIHFTQVNRSGVELPSAGRSVGAEAVATAEQLGPRIAWNGSAYGLAWLWKNLTTRYVGFSLLTADGRMTGTRWELGAMPSVGLDPPPSLVWNESTGEFVVAWADPVHTWTDCGGGMCATEIYFARVTRDGTLIDRGVRATSGVAPSRLPALAVGPDFGVAGNGVGLAWSDERDGNAEIYFTVLRCVDR